MAIFQAKATPTKDKLRGGYYTPKDLAEFVVRWAVRDQTALDVPLKVLEPSCGNGALLHPLAELQADVVAVELEADEAKKAASLGVGRVHNMDFFKWLHENKSIKFDAVVGNPPYIRFGSWKDSERQRALNFIQSEGLRPSKLINAWLPFVIAAVKATKPGGRVALVLPAELLQTSYASETRRFLVEHCLEITLISFKKLLFDGVLQEVVLLLAIIGDGPASFNSIEVTDSKDLNNLLIPHAKIPAPENHAEKWTTFYLGYSNVQKVRSIKNDPRLKRISDFARVNVGVVTGRNAFFCLNQDQVKAEKLERWVIPLVARSAHLSGLMMNKEKLKANKQAGYVTFLLSVAEKYEVKPNSALAKYIAKGEANGVHTGYKTRIRKKWWSVPSVTAPDGFMLRQISTYARLFANHTSATSTDTVHRIFMNEDSVTIDQLCVAALNSITISHGELLGRSYGGGILELEPSEAASLPIPDPRLVDMILIEKVSNMLEEDKIDEAIDLIDNTLLISKLGYTVDELSSFREVQHLMSNRRKNRGKKF